VGEREWAVGGGGSRGRFATAGARFLVLLLAAGPGLHASAFAIPDDPWTALDDLIAAGDGPGAVSLAGEVRGLGAEALRRYAAKPPAEDAGARPRPRSRPGRGSTSWIA
jgi:hypothetical protein